VDATSGQVTLRAEVANPKAQLLPGLYVRGRLAQAQIDDAVLVPQQAVTRTGQGDTVFVLGPDNKPLQRNVKIGGAQGNQWIVLTGLSPGEQVIVDGFQKMRPGATVRPVAVQPAASAPGPAIAAVDGTNDANGANRPQAGGNGAGAAPTIQTPAQRSAGTSPNEAAANR
jgi:membrane fusion protein (multidrug efflux system)